MVPEVCVENGVGGEQYFDPSWEQIETLLHSLDGRLRSALFIGDIDNLHYLDVSGGYQGRFQVVLQKGDEGYYTLIKPAKGKREIEITTGGMGRSCPSEACQTLKTVQAVAKLYFEIGENVLNTKINWRKFPSDTNDKA